MMSSYKNAGFTLVELVVSLAILSIVALFALQAVSSGIRNVSLSGNKSNLEVFAVSEIEKVILDPTYNGQHFVVNQPGNLEKSKASIEIFDVLIPGELIHSKTANFNQPITDFKNIYTFFRVISPYGTYTPGNAFITKSDPAHTTFQLGDIEVKPADLKARYKHIGKGTLVVPQQSALSAAYTDTIDWEFENGIIIKSGVLLESSKDIKLTAPRIDLSEAKLKTPQSIVVSATTQLILRSTTLESTTGMLLNSNGYSLLGTNSLPAHLKISNTNLLTIKSGSPLVLDTHYNIYTLLNGTSFDPNIYNR